jgi:hypothetical protein
MDHDWKFIGWDPSPVSSQPSAISTIGTSHFKCIHCGMEKKVGRTDKNHRTPPTAEELRLRQDPNADLFDIPAELTCNEEAVRDVMES